MIKRLNLTDDQLDQIAEWREAGKTYKWIALRIGCSPGLVRWNCLKLGADDPKGPSRAPSNQPMITMRGGHVVRRFTEAEDAELLRLAEAGERNSVICRALGRRNNSVKGRLLTLAMNQSRREVAV